MGIGITMYYIRGTRDAVVIRNGTSIGGHHNVCKTSVEVYKCVFMLYNVS